MQINSIYTVFLATTFLFLAGCSQQEDSATVTESESAMSEATSAMSEATSAMSETASDMMEAAPAEMTREQRTAERMAISEATDFNMDPLLDPNTATVDQLAAVEGLSAEQVQAIIDGRPFATPSELHAAIGENMSDDDMFDVYSAVFVKVNLNRGDPADFRLVPTTLTPDHIAREFVEYRPYGDMSDFSPEMRKYVSAKEVAFLERFVIID